MGGVILAVNSSFVAVLSKKSEYYIRKAEWSGCIQVYLVIMKNCISYEVITQLNE